jgi:hypothetical protein
MRMAVGHLEIGWYEGVFMRGMWQRWASVGMVVNQAEKLIWPKAIVNVA